MYSAYESASGLSGGFLDALVYSRHANPTASLTVAWSATSTVIGYDLKNISVYFTLIKVVE